MGRRIDGWKDRWVERWMDRQMDGRTDGRWVTAAYGMGLGAAPKGGEDSEGGLCANNKLPSSEEGKLGQ